MSRTRQHIHYKQTFRRMKEHNTICQIKTCSNQRYDYTTVGTIAVLTGVRAANIVANQLDLEKVSVVLWSDSKCGLHWIQNRPKLQTKFIQNRVKEIRKVNFSFRYIPSGDKPVDIATKKLSPTRLRQ